MQHAFAVLKRCSDISTQLRFVGRIDRHTGHRQFYRVLFESIDAWKVSSRQEVPVYAQVGVTTWACPVR